jgi:O-antigen biosynthesis protein WbqV
MRLMRSKVYIPAAKSLFLRVHHQIARIDRGLVVTVLAIDTILAVVAVSLVQFSGIVDSPTSIVSSPPVPQIPFAAGTVTVFYALGVPRKVWRHIATHDISDLISATALAVLVGAILRTAQVGALPSPLGLEVVHLAVIWMTFLALASTARILWAALVRSQPGEQAGSAASAPVPVLVAGAGSDCSRLLGQLREIPSPPMAVVGIVSPSPEWAGRRIGNVSVLGTFDDIPRVVADLERRGQKPDRLIITGAPAPEEMRVLTREAVRLGVIPSVLPPESQMMRELLAGNVPAMPVTLEDLVGRRPHELDPAIVAELIGGRRLLVTGAGGSIGQQMVEMIARFSPASIALLDNCEFNLWRISSRLDQKWRGVSHSAWLADIRDRGRLDQVFDAVKPELVFHAAALKHVPMVEANPAEGILTNVLGSRNVADAALRSRVTAMVQVSTDKAVKPSSVMGATKRLAELYCQAIDIKRDHHEDGTRPRFLTVRFGNVLGSSGSVVPVFQKQIDLGGPVTVTHPEVERYFMTIPEACELVLHAAARGVRGEIERGIIEVLDMGEPVRIVDIARQLIVLNGKRPDVDIQVRFVGLRPGEKLNEELFDANETRVPGGAEGLISARSIARPLEQISRTIDELEQLARRGDRRALLEALAQAVPGYPATVSDTIGDVAA